jgi:hypothetical protein
MVDLNEALEVIGQMLPSKITVTLENTDELKYRLMRQFDIDFIENAAHALGVCTEEDAKQALSMALQSRKLEKALEDSRLEIVRPHMDYQRAINKLVKDFKDKLEKIETNLKVKIDAWIGEQKENPFTALDELKVEDGSLYTQKSWDFEILNYKTIPQEYLETNVDVAKIERDVKNGVRDIAGVRIFQKEKTVMRVKN